MRYSFLVVLASLALVLAGCGDSAISTKAPPSADLGKTTDGQSDRGNVEIAANLAKLPAADRAGAEKQRDCPVSGELLGSMGAPIKVTVKEREAWLCCSGCTSKFKADPDKYLAKLK